MTNPNIAIIRIPTQEGVTFDNDSDGEFTFIVLDIVDGVVANEGQLITVDEGDAYREMEFSHIVLAERTEEGSLDLGRYKIGGPDGVPDGVEVYNIPHAELVLIIQELLKVHDESQQA